MSDDRGEPVLALANFDVPGLFENIDRGLAGYGLRAGAESQGDFPLPVHERRLLLAGVLDLSGLLADSHVAYGHRQAEARNRKNAGREMVEFQYVFHRAFLLGVTTFEGLGLDIFFPKKC